MPHGIMQRIPRLLPPNPAPTGTRCLQIDVPNDDYWVRDFYSVIESELAKWIAWERDPGKHATIVAQRWKIALATLRYCTESVPVVSTPSEEKNMPEIRTVCDNNVTYVEVKVCACPETWLRLANADQITAGGQPAPAGGGAPPGGGTQKTCAKLQASGQILLPTLISTGDTIILNSCDGAWWDGGEFDFGPLYRFGSNGDQYVGGIDAGFPHVTGTDPAVTANHMTVIAAIGSTPTYLALPIGVAVTIPSGHSKEQVYIQCNDTAISNNQGSCDVCVTVTNNAAGTWSGTADFTISPYGWQGSSIPGKLGFWSPGQGWTPDSGYGFNTIIIDSPVTASYGITSASITIYDPALSGSSHVYLSDLVTAFNFIAAAPIPGSSGTIVVSQLNAGPATHLEINLSDTGALLNRVISLSLQGTGVKPSWLP